MNMNEEQIHQFWKQQKIYNKLKQKLKNKKKFYFLDGPPYATGNIHIGTAWNKILKDCYIRFWRMKGFNVWDQPGYDTHGLPIEKQVEKEQKLKTKSDIEKMGIEKFIAACRTYATKYIDVMSGQFEDLGVWMDWENPYLTLNNEYIEGAWHTFKIAYEKGLLYHDLYAVHVCPKCETAVAYNEIEYDKATDPSIYVKFKVKKRDEYLVIWTTTPWTLPANVAVMVHPDADYVKIKVSDEILIIAKELLENFAQKTGLSYEIKETIAGWKLKNLEYSHPMEDIFTYQKKIKHKVVLSKQYVNFEKGTGLVHTAPGHGEEDYKVGKLNRLDIVSPVKMNGTFDETTGKYAGRFVKEADKDIIEELRSRNLIILEEKINHDYPFCWRCKSALLLICVPQWFFRVTKIRQKLLKENEKVNWYPAWAKSRFKNWLENLGDWPISRQRYWGIPLPIWKCNSCKETKVVGSVDELPEKLDDLHRPYIDRIKIKCKCGKDMKRISDVLDVWFDSGLASWASLGYPKNKELFNMWPSELQIEGPDQIRGWWNSELITSIITFNKAPFKNILFHGFILDAHGIKMSKSVGNVIEPVDIIKKYDRDVLRMYLLSSPAWDDFNASMEEAGNIFKSLTIIRNTFNFVKTYVPHAKPTKTLNIEDRWILSRLNSVIESSTKHMEGYEVNKLITEVNDFLVNEFSRFYIKLIRDRVWVEYKGKDREAAFYTLYEVTKNVSRLLAPVAPFMAENVHQTILRPLGDDLKSVHLAEWPEAENIDKEIEKEMTVVQEIVESVNSVRNEKKVKMRWPLQKVILDLNEKKLDEYSGIIKRMCNVKEVKFARTEKGKEFSFGKIYLDTELTKELKEEALYREVIRKIQDMRKKEGFVVKDKIKLFLHGAEDIEKFKSDLKKEVGAESIILGKSKGKTEKLLFEDKEIIIGIEKL